jgi:hypothetical protein
MAENIEWNLKIVERTPTTDDRTGQADHFKDGSKTRLIEDLSLVNRRGLTAKMRKWKWLFVDIHESEVLICIAMG